MTEMVSGPFEGSNLPARMRITPVTIAVRTIVAAAG
jgi:hypothetical protein